MTEVLHSPSHFPSSSSSLSYAPTTNNGGCLSNQIQTHSQSLINSPSPRSSPVVEDDLGTDEDREPRERDKEGDHLPILALLLTAFRKSLAACRTERKELCSMEISWPTNVRHVAHVTFDRFDGFLGLPVEFEPEVPRRAPSASANVFGVSTESMQLSYDSRGNSVPTILLLMQRRLYSQEGLQAEGIFRINAENSQEEYVRDQLNQGVVPDGVDVHCLAGLIKAWFRELPSGVLDTLTPEQVMRCESEEECTQLVKLLPSTEAALLNWVVNLMADVVQEEHLNKMSARNIAMVFAPNMTQMADPLTALMYAVQVMNFLKMLILRTLKERQDSVLESASASHIEPSDENGHHSSSQPCLEASAHDNEGTNLVFVSDEPRLKSSPNFTEDHSTIDIKTHGFESSIEKVIQNENGSIFYDGSSKTPMQDDIFLNEEQGISVASRINLRAERVEAWR